MRRKKRDLPVFERVEILDAAAEGKSVARVNDQVIFVPHVVPGDIVDLKITQKRKSYMKGRAEKIHHYSEKRTAPRCEHFGVCGGCKWQNMQYTEQLYYKQKQVVDNLSRLGKFQMPEVSPILPSDKIYYYRNKLEYTFSNKRWLTEYSKDMKFEDRDMNALGFHMPGMFDRVLDINNCYLQDEPSNQIRLALKAYTSKHNLPYYDIKNWAGFLRNIIIRNTTTGDLMVILIVRTNDEPTIFNILDFLNMEFPQITSLMYVINDKKNAVITDLDIHLYKGKPYIIEQMEDLKFKIGPVSFYQTNSMQAYELYKVVRNFAEFKGEEVVYDLYTGTGTIANFIASQVKKVIGIEYIDAAIKDAFENAALNQISNTDFFAGDIAKILDDDFVDKNGRPDVIISDPPRAGMHLDVNMQLLKMEPARIVYVSCNPATQARDVTILSEKYTVAKIQPIDMFPHTHHVENVMLLLRK
ncbi:MAG: 23S rRNA (uracil(1939)-C(5))-methyltransferase RlmD [Bacteroidales bacterium]|nr:23S rRNA (uracil(1939)-C(5))-methyltransferase RlmD [Bacteroidales bacterium]MCF8404346.1 23S rRNA (uracil(1939)-C(5))-methyltransferase RlmD [Bacteroidales bacterium]